MKQLIKRVIAAALYYSGALALYAAVSLRGRAVVLTYHRVLPRALQSQSFSSPAIVVTPETFRKHCECIRRWLNPIAISEFVQRLSTSGGPPSRSCLITFDDGWFDNLAFALPVLKEQRVPIALFVATDYIDSDRCFWQEELGALLFEARRAPAATQAALKRLNADHILHLDHQAARQAIFGIVSGLKAVHADVQSAVDELRNALSSIEQRENVDRFLRLSELRELHASGHAAIGSHGRSHSRLPFLEDAAIAAELSGSRTAIQSWLGEAPATLAYPNGDYDARVLAAAQQAGYTAAFTTERGYVDETSAPLKLRRINMHEGAAPTKAMFMCRVLGLM